MGIPIIFFYYLYLVFVAVYLFFTFFNVYHLVRFGFVSFSNIILIIFYLAVSTLILMISWQYISQVNWLEPLPLIPKNNFQL